MTDKLRAAARAALRVLVAEPLGPRIGAEKAEAILRAALAEPTCKQDLQAAEPDAEPDAEPFLWYDDETGDTWTAEAVREGCAPQGLRPLYAAPPRRSWVSLTEEEWTRLHKDWMDNETTDSYDLMNSVEAALKEKNID